MIDKYKFILPVLALALAGTLAFGTMSAYAQDSESYPFAARMAERFGLSEDEVGAFMNESREERQIQNRQEAQNRFEEKLSEAVEQGLITEEQKGLIIQKHEELMGERRQNREEMQVWAEENGIDLDELQIGPIGPKGVKGFGGGFGR